MSTHVQMKVSEFCFWTLIAFAIGWIVALAFVAPQQADARAEIPPPTVEHTR